MTTHSVNTANMLENFLQNLGLSEKESQIYLTMIQIGVQGANVIAKKANLARTTTYSVLETLIEKGFADSFEKNNIKYFFAEDPENLIFKINEEERKIKEQKEQFQELLPNLISLKAAGQSMPKVRYFEGLDGIKEIYEDTLKEGKDKLAYSSISEISKQNAQELFEYNLNYLKRRKALNMHVRAIFPDTPISREYTKKDKEVLRESRLVPPDLYPFESEINIYGNKIAIMSLKSNNYHGVIIESEPIVKTERSVFELAWLGAAKFI